MRERADGGDDAQVAVVRDPPAGIGVGAAVTVDQHVLRSVPDVPQRHRADEDHGRDRRQGRAARRVARCDEDRSREHEQCDPCERTEREHDGDAVHTGDRGDQSDGAEGHDRRRGDEREDAHPPRLPGSRRVGKAPLGRFDPARARVGMLGRTLGHERRLSAPDR